jgi:hypothetical protein
MNVGHQRVAQLVVLNEDGLGRLIGPYLILRPMTMRTEYRTERPELEPTGVEILVVGFLRGAVVCRPVSSGSALSSQYASQANGP